MKIYWDEIDAIAKAHHLERPISTEALVRILQWWWCRHYNRPLKDPLLKEYTLNDLAYEYLRHYYTRPENDPRKQIEESQVTKDDEDWILKQLESHKQVAKAVAPAIEGIKNALGDAAPAAEQPVTPEEIAQIPDLPTVSTKFDE